MCYQWGDTGIYNKKNSLNILDYELIASIIKECSPWKPVYNLFGGEPLLYKRIWDVIDLIKHAGSKVYMDTNGTLLESNAQRIIRSGIDIIWVSLDGTLEINDHIRGKNVYNRVIKGLEKLNVEKEANSLKSPKIGITYVVTPLNYLFVEKLFCKDIDLSLLEYISIEFQNYITKNEYNDYELVLMNEFGISEFPSASSIVRDLDFFSTINSQVLSEQINNVKKKSEEHNVKVFTSPEVVDEENIENYFTANWNKCKDRKTSCPLPWIYAEITASGDVTTCHTFYDFTLGNINENSIRDIFNNDKIKKYRNLLKSRKLYGVCYGCARYHTNIHHDALM
jgi:radical SAM protein with 4Fe4S-binding SPASM domain